MPTYIKETPIYNTGLITTDAAKTATNYIFADSTGIKIANGLPQTATTYQLQTYDRTEFFVSNESRALIGGPGVRLGKPFDANSNSNESHIELDYHSFKMLDKNGDPYLWISDLRHANGVATIVETFNAYMLDDGTIQDTYYITCHNALDNGTMTVTVNNETCSWFATFGEVGDPIEGAHYVLTGATIESTLEVGDVVTITYEAEDNFVKAYTLGTRLLNSDIGVMSFVEGYDNTASGGYSHAGGVETVASGLASYAEGSGTKASGAYSHAGGYGAIASGKGSFAIGSETEAAGTYSSAMGIGTRASGISSYAMGIRTQASGISCYAEGNSTIAYNQFSHAEGDKTRALGIGSHAEGGRNQVGGLRGACGRYSHSEGFDTEAVGEGSHSEGYKTSATGNYSHAQNNQTLASSAYQTAIGKYNIEDTNDIYAFLVGNGTSEERSNAFAVKWTGDADISRILTLRDDTIDRDSTPSSNLFSDQHCIEIRDKDDDLLMRLRSYKNTNGDSGAQLLAWNEPDGGGTSVYNAFAVVTKKDGTKTYTMSDPAAFRDALGASSGVWPASLIATLNQDTTGNAATATKLNTAREIYVALGTTRNSESPVTFDGSAAKAIHVSGTLPASRGGTGHTSLQATRSAMGLGNTTEALPIANGGTGSTSKADALSALGAQAALSVTTASSGIFTAGSGVTIVGQHYAQYGKIGQISLEFKISAAKAATANTTIATISTTSRRPKIQTGASFGISTDMRASWIDTNGQCHVQAAITANTTYYFWATYIIP